MTKEDFTLGMKTERMTDIALAFKQTGAILAESEEKGSVIWADIDPDLTISDFTGLPLGRRYDLIRRADTFGPLTQGTGENLEV